MYRCKTTYRSVITGRSYFIGTEITYEEYTRIPFVEKNRFEKIEPLVEDSSPSLGGLLEIFEADIDYTIGMDKIKEPDPTEFGGGSFGGGGASGDWDEPEDTPDLGGSSD